jgi:hypothetical protein
MVISDPQLKSKPQSKPLSVSIGQISKELAFIGQRFVIASVAGEKPKRIPGSGKRSADNQPIAARSLVEPDRIPSRRRNACSYSREAESFPGNGLVYPAMRPTSRSSVVYFK